MRTRWRWVAVALAVAGIVALFLAWSLRRSVFALAFFTNLGVGVLRFVALSLLVTPFLQRQEERQQRTEDTVARLTDEVREVEEQVEETRGRLETLGEETRTVL